MAKSWYLLRERFGDIIARIREATGFRTQLELADILSIRQSSVSSALNSGTVPAEWLLKLCLARGINPDWLVHGREPRIITAGPAVAGAVGGWLEFPGVAESGADYATSGGRSIEPLRQVGTGEDCSRWVSVSGVAAPGTAIFRAEDDAMRPVLLRGAYVGVDTLAKELVDGDIFAIRLSGDRTALRRVFRSMQDETCRLVCINPEYPASVMSFTMIRDRIIGRAVWTFQSLD